MVATDLCLLVVPYGELVNYVHMGYASTYEQYILLEMDKGDLKKTKNFSYKEYEKFKERQFEAFKKTEEYKKLKEQAETREGYEEESFDGFLGDFIVDYTSKFLVD